MRLFNASETMPKVHQNAFDAVRLVLASLVVYSHAYFLGGFGGEGFAALVRHQTGAGTLAVLGFFGLSGFLVTQSFVARNDWKAFVASRLLRILPALYLALVLTAFVFAPAVSHFNATSGPWDPADAGTFVLRNLLVRVGQWSVGGVLTGLPYDESLNGALWSLFPELVCYGVVLVLGLVGSLHARRANLVVFALLVVGLHFGLVLSPDRENLAPTLLSLTGWTPYVTAFVVGAVASLFRTELGLGGRQAVFWWGVVAVLLKFGGWALLGPVALPLALINVAYSFRVNLSIDLSYGIYVLHFPILQVLAAGGVHRLGVVWYLAIGSVVTVLFALLSWFLVERPALNLKAKRPAAGATQ